MTVITSSPSPSRAGSLDLIADDLALDFANTESGRGFPSHENHLREAQHVALWLKHAKALPTGDADWLWDEASKRADLAADLMTQAIGLRAAIHDIDRQLQLWGLAEDVYYGLSLGAVLLLAATGLAIMNSATTRARWSRGNHRLR